MGEKIVQSWDAESSLEVRTAIRILNIPNLHLAILTSPKRYLLKIKGRKMLGILLTCLDLEMCKTSK